MDLTRWWGRFTHGDRTARTLGVAVPVTALVVIYLVAVWTVPGQWLDDRLFGRAQGLAPGPLGELVPALARGALPAVLTAGVLVLWVTAVVRRWWREVVVATAAIVVTVALARFLREDVLARPALGPYGYPENTLPSTHVAGVTVLVLVVLLLWPWDIPWWLGWAGVGVVAFAGLGNVIGHAHLPSDAVAGVLLAWAMTDLGVLVLRPDLTRRRGPRPRRGPPRSAPR
jgi:membrane-associated phospholipid phosphatase